MGIIPTVLKLYKIAPSDITKGTLTATSIVPLLMHANCLTMFQLAVFIFLRQQFTRD